MKDTNIGSRIEKQRRKIGHKRGATELPIDEMNELVRPTARETFQVTLSRLWRRGRKCDRNVLK